MWRRINFYFLLPSVILIVFSLGSWGYISTHQQQLSAYVSSQLSSQLGSPLILRNATLGFHPTPTLDFEQISFTSKDQRLHCTMPNLHVGFSWRDLLHGQFICAKLILLQPQIYWQQSVEQSGKAVTSTAPTTQRAPIQIGQLLRTAKIIDGTMFLSGKNNHASLKASARELHNFNATVTSGGQQLTFTTSGDLQQENLAPAHIELTGKVQDISADWLDAPIRLAAKIDNLSGSNIQLPQKYSLGGTYNLQLDLHGQRTSKLNIVALATSRHANQQLTINGTEQLPIKIVGLDSQLRWDNNCLSTEKLKLRYNELLLDADLQISDLSGAPQLHSVLHSNQLPVQYFMPYLPDHTSINIPQQLEQLRVQCQHLEIEAPLNDLRSATIKQAQLSLQHEGFTYQKLSAAQFSAQLNWDGKKALLSTTPITFADQNSSLHGPLNIKFSPTANHSWAIDIDLTPLTLDAAKIITKAAGAVGHINAIITPPQQQDATEQNQTWNIAAGEFTIPQYQLLFTGRYGALDNYHLDMQLPNYELESISSKVDLLNYMQLKGNIAASYSLNQQVDHQLHGSGQVFLHDCAISPTYVIAPIHHINGTLDLDNFSVKAPGLKLMLGDSPMQVDATIADLRHTVAQLHATGNGVIASDLVFNNPAMVLNNLDGTINIHAQGIDFVTASVDLENGTHAEVSGKLFFSPIFLELDINAPSANIDEVIALWQYANEHTNDTATAHNYATDVSASSTTSAASTSGQDQEFIHINAHVDHGEISGFAFHNANGTIHYQHGQLRIEPLYFNADNGSGNGTVLVVMDQKNAQLGSDIPAEYSLLKIAGDIHTIDADKVYSQLLKHSGIVTGSLSGNFHIQGPIGGNFLPNSQGTFHIDIKNGVLRQFKVLSKAFSLLNVAQLFSLNLPDMDRQGMPFQHLSSDIDLINGTLHSDNLVIDSRAMGLTIVGKHDLVNDQLDIIMGVKPLGTVDTVVNNLPIAGWILAGDEKALIAPNFSVTGSAQDPQVSMLSVSSVANKLFGIMERTITLPSKLIQNPLKILTNIGK